MIKFENTSVFNLEGAIRGMRNPKNSWHLSDSVRCGDREECEGCEFLDVCKNQKKYVSEHDIVTIGENDMKLMKNLIKAGTDHRKFMRQILVSVDITAPLYFWKEADTYKVGTVANSCSTMHKIHAKKFTLDDFSHEHLTDDIWDRGLMDSVIVDEDPKSYSKVFLTPLETLKCTIEQLNICRANYIETKDKKWWWQMIQLLPSSYNQKRTVTLNYEVIRNMYHSRKNHKLDEWNEGFVEWVELLPYCNELIIE